MMYHLFLNNFEVWTPFSPKIFFFVSSVRSPRYGMKSEIIDHSYDAAYRPNQSWDRNILDSLYSFFTEIHPLSSKICPLRDIFPFITVSSISMIAPLR